MLGVEAVAEGMGDHGVGHHPTMPGLGKTAQAVVATRRLENSLHASIMRQSSLAFRKTMPRHLIGTRLSLAPVLSRSLELDASCREKSTADKQRLHSQPGDCAMLWH